MILITPINAHNLNSRSIVIGAEDEVVVEIGRRRLTEEDETLEVSFDGDTAARLVVGDKLQYAEGFGHDKDLKAEQQELSRDAKQKDAGIHISGKRRAE